MGQRNYFDQAREYLLSFDGVTDAIIEVHLNEWETRKPSNINELFRAFLTHAQNRQGMPNSIGDIDRLGPVLLGFNPREVTKLYTSWETLFDAIKAGAYRPPGRLEKNNARSYWVIYCKSILSIAGFLGRYQALEEYDRFVAGFLTNEHSRLALPLLLKEELFGFGFALACDLLKETGYPYFVKPDTHLNDIARGLGISKAENDFGVFKDVEAWCEEIGELPYRVDKMFWLVGSGKFYMSGLNIPSSKRRFLELVTAEALNRAVAA
jgi:hypothetical protein